MRTRFANFFAQHNTKLMVVAAGGAAYSYYDSYKKGMHSIKGGPLSFYPLGDDLAWYARNYSPRNVNLQRDQAIISDAFKQVGFTKPVYFRYVYDRPTTSMNGYDQNGQYSAYVSINNSDVSQSDNRDLALYALMGREAVHALHDDDREIHIRRALYIGVVTFEFLEICKQALAKCPPTINKNIVVLGLMLACIPGFSSTFVVEPIKSTFKFGVNLLTAPRNYYQEMRADSESAEKLGTATVLADFVSKPRFTWLERHWFMRFNSPIYLRTDDYLAGLPPFPVHDKRVDLHELKIKYVPNDIRASYLRELESESAHTPRLFQSKVYQEFADAPVREKEENIFRR